MVQEPLQLTQAFRNFEGTSPWEQVGEGVSYVPNEYQLVPPAKEEEPPKDAKK